MGRRYDKNLEKIRQKMLEAKEKLPPGTVAPTQIAADPTTDDQLYLDVSRQINRWENVISFDDLKGSSSTAATRSSTSRSASTATTTRA